MKKNLVCIICPRGCGLCVTGEKGDLKVSGNACKRGERYAIDECTSPMRTVTAVVRVENRTDTMVSVKTEGLIPKDKIFEVMEIINKTKVSAPVKIGDMILSDVFDTKIIATKSVE